jgi:hypothetical protein
MECCKAKQVTSLRTIKFNTNQRKTNKNTRTLPEERNKDQKISPMLTITIRMKQGVQGYKGPVNSDGGGGGELQLYFD